MAFGVGCVVTNKGKAMFADRVQTTPATYTTAPKWGAMGVGATGAGRTAAAADTALSTEVESRTSGTEAIVTTSVTGDTYQVTYSITATSNRSVDEFGLFDANAAGNMFVSGTQNVVSLVNLDVLAFVVKAQQT